MPRQPGRFTRCQPLAQHVPPFIWIFEKVYGHCYDFLGVSFGLTFENTDITCKDNEVAPDLHDSVFVHVASPCLRRGKNAHLRRPFLFFEAALKVAQINGPDTFQAVNPVE
jgi:hypothetical protein